MARVFVVQNPNSLNRNTGKLEPKYDLTDALRFGELVEVLPPPANPFKDVQQLVQQIHAALFDFRAQEDYVLLIGSPVFIGMVVGIAADYGDGDVSLLQWSGTQRCYIPLTINNLFMAQD